MSGISSAWTTTSTIKAWWLDWLTLEFMP